MFWMPAHWQGGGQCRRRHQRLIEIRAGKVARSGSVAASAGMSPRQA